MGTTLETVLIIENTIFFAHVGDSRIYKKSGENFRMLTKDHSLVEYLFSNGALTKEEVKNFKNKNSILRAIGTEKNVEIDTGVLELEQGDLILVCSDGLTNELNDFEIDSILNTDLSSEELVNLIINEVKNRTAKDNITVGIFKYDEV